MKSCYTVSISVVLDGYEVKQVSAASARLEIIGTHFLYSKDNFLR